MNNIQDNKKQKLLRLTKVISLGFLWVVVVVGLFWSLLALWFDSSRNDLISGIVCAVFVSVCILIIFKSKANLHRLAFLATALLLVIVWWKLIPAKNDREWLSDVAELPSAKIEGNKLLIKNVRNFEYGEEGKVLDENWESRTYDLDELEGVDLFICSWGPKLIVHTIVSWQFKDQPPLAISIETRKEKGEAYSAVLGFFRQFELYYVVADERDVVRLRTNFLDQKVHLYRIRMSAEGAKAVLLDYMKEINALNENPEWYNAASHNCTTTIRHHALHVGEGHPWDWRILVNGYLDELGYERETIDTSLPFPELKLQSDITSKALNAGDSLDFSKEIRIGLPGERSDAN